MTTFRAIRESLRLLAKGDRRRLLLVALTQASTSLLDLFGVVLLGLVGGLAVAMIQGSSPPPVIEATARTMGWATFSNAQLLVLLAGAAALFLLMKSFLSTFLLRKIFIFLARRQAGVSARLSSKLLARPITFLQERSSQQTAFALVQGVGSAVLVILGQGVVLLSELALLVLLGLIVFLIDPLVALSSIAFFSLVALVLHGLLGRWAQVAGETLAKADIASLNSIQEAMAAYREISVTDRRHFYVITLDGLRRDASGSAATLQFISTLPKYVFEVALVVGGFALAASLLATRDIVDAVGTLVLFLAAASRVMPSILRLQNAALMIRNATGFAASTMELAEALEDSVSVSIKEPSNAPADTADHEGFADFSPELVFRNVTYTYPGAREPAIADVSLTVRPGGSVALVGTSGAGKTTFADILLGILEPQRGEVLIGSAPPSEAIRRWPGEIGYVPQVVTLSNASVRDNVALGLPRETFDDEMVWAALERAHLVRFFDTRPEGLDTQIGEGGVRMSGGQRQRLGIARALFTHPRLLVLDEATSALDAETELAISQTVGDLEGSVTTVTIAHRLSTIRASENILYLEKGRIVARGDFTEVSRAVPSFLRQAQIMGLA